LAALLTLKKTSLPKIRQMNSKTQDQDYGHWDIDLVGEFNPEDHLGFVYQITRLDSGRSYIGCKHLWKYSRGKRKAASEWRNYISSSNYLKPEIKELGKEAFSFKILMLCDNKRNLYYNELKLQVELGVLEDECYYNANIGGIRFYRPVKSYLNPELRAKLSANVKGTDNGRYQGPFTVTFNNGTAIRVEDKTLKDFCEEHGLNKSALYKVRTGKRKIHKGIIKVEYDYELEEN